MLSFDFAVRIHYLSQAPLTADRVCPRYNLEFYLGGEGGAVVDGVEYPHKKGNVLLVRPGQVRHTRGEMECYGIHFSCTDPAFLTDYLDTLPPLIYAPETEGLFARLVKEEDALEVTALFLRILARLHRRPASEEEKDAEEIQKVLTYLQENYTQPIVISSLPTMTYFSHTLFFQAFRRHTGRSPAAYLCEWRLARAKELLLSTDLSMGEISYRCGFRSQAYFNDVFRRHFGQSPTEYRREVWKQVL